MPIAKLKHCQPTWYRAAERWLGGHVPVPRSGIRTFSGIEAALAAYAKSVTTATWRRMRSDIARYFVAQGGPMKKLGPRIRAITNPVAIEARARRPRRCKAVNEKIAAKLYQDAIGRQDNELAAALLLAGHLGVRPVEMPTLRVTSLGNGNMVVIVKGAKKREDRSMDRELMVPENQRLRTAVETLFGKRMKPIQDRLARASQRLFPRRKTKVSLYSFRHQLGSDLKAFGGDRRVAAAIMGHRSQDSLTSYGNAKSGRTRRRLDASQRTTQKVDQKSPRVHGFRSTGPSGCKSPDLSR